MALKEQINNDLKAALLGGNRFDGEVLRGLKAVILNEEVAKGLRDIGLDDNGIQQIIVREVKKRNDSAKIYEDAGRPELVENELMELKVLSKYLPKQLSEDEIKLVINQIIDGFGGKESCQMGQVIGAVKKELGNSADGSVIAKLVKDSLI